MMEAFMGLFDQVVSGALKGVMGQGGSGLLPGLLSQVLGNTNLGSAGGLLAQLQQGGLGNEVASWLSNGANMAVSPDQLRSALGNDHLQQMAQSSGLPLDGLLAMLAKQLPGTIDKMSPNGALEESAGEEPSGDLADQAGLGDIRS
jgi:uncharacterized protein YidB (DUF937 family)